MCYGYSTYVRIYHCCIIIYVFLFFNDPATTEIYTLSLHDALPIYAVLRVDGAHAGGEEWRGSRNNKEEGKRAAPLFSDRKSTRLNSSHTVISYAVFCLKKKKKNKQKQ